MEKITYASLSNLGDDFHKAFDNAVIHERKKIGDSHLMFIAGKGVKGAKTFDDTNPSAPEVVLGRFQAGGREQARKAVTAAKNALPFWRELGWPARVSFVRKAAELMAKNQFDLAA